MAMKTLLPKRSLREMLELLMSLLRNQEQDFKKIVPCTYYRNNEIIRPKNLKTAL